jgi:tRNA-Thr(GGU) m(6)t(6)A37 methyltransferase TsaA
MLIVSSKNENPRLRLGILHLAQIGFILRPTLNSRLILPTIKQVYRITGIHLSLQCPIGILDFGLENLSKMTIICALMDQTDTQSVSQIGIVHSCFTQKFGIPRQANVVPETRAFLEIHRRYQPELSLQGLTEFSHVWVIFLFHELVQERFHAKIHPPRLNGETIGLFATRSPHRPSRIGLSVCKIDEIKPNGIWLSGIDIADQSPVLDIKPYVPDSDKISEAKSGWTNNTEARNLLVTWTPQATQQLADLFDKPAPNQFGLFAPKLTQVELQTLITNLIALDPRPNVYRGNEQKYSDAEHVISVYGIDFYFVAQDGSATVTRLPGG